MVSDLWPPFGLSSPSYTLVPATKWPLQDSLLPSAGRRFVNEYITARVRTLCCPLQAAPGEPSGCSSCTRRRASTTWPITCRGSSSGRRCSSRRGVAGHHRTRGKSRRRAEWPLTETETFFFCNVKNQQPFYFYNKVLTRNWKAAIVFLFFFVLVGFVKFFFILLCWSWCWHN